MDSTTGGMIISALAAGGASVARAEIARVIRAAVQRLKDRGQAGQELAVVADALARSDAELAAELTRLPDDGKGKAANQLDAALVYDGPEPVERAATEQLAIQARDLVQMLREQGRPRIRQSFTVADNARVNAPAVVERDFIAELHEHRDD